MDNALRIVTRRSKTPGAPAAGRALIFLVYGASGFVGKQLVKSLDNMGAVYVCSKARTWDVKAVEEDIRKFNPTHVINASGYATPDNVDHYETHEQELTLTNTTGVLALAHACWKAHAHYTVIMSGCIYEGGPWKDTDEPNFKGSAYSNNRVLTEKLLAPYKACIVRIRMPVTRSMHPKSLITKLLKYKKVSTQGNSITIMEDMMPVVYYLCKAKHVGPVNLVNKGTVTNIYILSLWDKYIQPHAFQPAESTEDLKCVAPRSNCEIEQSPCVEAVAKKYDIQPARRAVTDGLFDIVMGFKKTVDTYC